MKNKIIFTFKEKVKFKNTAKTAQEVGEETFMYKGIKIPTDYGVYLSEYLETVLPFPEYTGLTQPITINF